MRPRRRRQRQRYTDENVDRWMMSYADFITLLFAFFVVMYAISSVNESKYRVLAETLRSNFGEPSTAESARTAAAATPLEIETAEIPGRDVIPMLLRAEAGAAAAPDPAEGPLLQDLAGDLRGLLGGLIEKGKVALRRTRRGLELEINSRLLFSSGSSTLDERYRSLLVRVAEVLETRQNAVDVEGFTDDRPINTERFPSNWELSAARATAVIRLLVEHGVEPGRLAAVGYGPHRPVAANDTAAGRAKNRRVVLVIRDERKRLLLAAGEQT